MTVVNLKSLTADLVAGTSQEAAAALVAGTNQGAEETDHAISMTDTISVDTSCWNQPGSSC